MCYKIVALVFSSPVLQGVAAGYGRRDSGNVTYVHVQNLINLCGIMGVVLVPEASLEKLKPCNCTTSYRVGFAIMLTVSGLLKTVGLTVRVA